MTATAIAKTLHVDHKAVTELLATIDATTVSPYIREQAATAWGHYSTGMSLVAVAETMGTQPRTVRSWLIRGGYPRRPVGRPAAD